MEQDGGGSLLSSPEQRGEGSWESGNTGVGVAHHPQFGFNTESPFP